MSEPNAKVAPPDGLWEELQDSDLKAGIDKYFSDKKAAKGTYFALIVDVENPISGYHIRKLDSPPAPKA